MNRGGVNNEADEQRARRVLNDCNPSVEDARWLEEYCERDRPNAIELTPEQRLVLLGAVSIAAGLPDGVSPSPSREMVKARREVAALRESVGKLEQFAGELEGEVAALIDCVEALETRVAALERR